MEIEVLGALRVVGREGPVELRSQRERLLVAHLVVAKGRPVAIRTLVDGLWGDQPPRTAHKSLQNVVLRLRRTLEPVNGLVVTEPEGYRLVVDPEHVDAHRFEVMLRDAEADRHLRLEALRAALALWRGPAYDGLEHAPVITTEARRLEELRASAVEECVATELDVGNSASVVAELEGLVGAYPTRERLWALLMTALYRQGRQADALAAFDRARAILADDLGLDPGPELREVHSLVLRQEVTAASSAADAAGIALTDARSRVADTVLDMRSMSLSSDLRDVSPWPGLAAYAATDGPWFAGRERLVAELAARLVSSRCVAVVGGSGSGKSSMVQAGLLAGLADGLLPGSAAWVSLTMRPGTHPVAELARLVLGAPRPDVGAILERLVRAGPGEATDRTVLVIDQLEEVWTACADGAERIAFLDALAGLVTAEGSAIVLLLVVRADYLERLADHRELAAMVSDNTVLVGTPTPDDVRRMVLGPSRRAGLALDEGLADAVVTDAGREPGLLPLLSTSLRTLWERREGSRLTLASYVATGGLRGAISDLAESAFTALDPAEQVQARALLLRLTGPGDGDAVTRRRVRRAELADLAQDLTNIVEKLATARLLTLTDDHVEVAHEALFREWPRLRGWLDDDRAGRDIARRLAVASEEWRSEGEDRELLWRGTRLEAGLELVAAHAEERTSAELVFLEASRAAGEEARLSAERRAELEARQNRRLRAVLIAGLVLLVLTAAAAVVAVRSREREAEAAAESARIAVTANAKRLAASALTVEQADVALLTAVEATHDEQSPETYGAVLTLLARQPDVLTRIRTDNRFFTVAADRQGTAIYLGENAPVLRAVDPVTGEERWRRDDLAGMTGALAVSPDGSAVAAVLLTEESDEIVLLDAGSGRTLHTVTLADVNRATGGQAPYLWAGGGFTNTGKLVVATDDAVVRLSPRGHVLDSLPWPRRVFDDGTFLVWPDGRVSVGGLDGTPAVVLDTEDPRGAPQEVDGAVRAIDRATRRLVVTKPTGTGNELLVIDARTLEPLSNSWPVDPQTEVVRFSADGSLILVGAGERVELRDADGAAPLRELAGPNGGVAAGDFAGSRGDVLWTAGRDGTAVAFDLTRRRGVFATKQTSESFWQGEGASQADTVVWTNRVETDLNDVYLLRPDEREGRRLDARLDDCRCDATSSDLTPDGRLALGGFTPLGEDFQPLAHEGYVVVWDTGTLEVRAVVRTPWPVFAVDSAADGSAAVVLGGSGWGTVQLGNLARRESLDQLGELPDWVRQGTGTSLVEVAPDGQRAALLVEGDVLLVDLDSSRVVARREVETGPTGFAQSAAWTPDGRTIAVGTTNGWLHELDAEKLDAVAPRRLVTSGVLSDVEMSPDGDLAATIGPEGDVTLWDTSTWRPYGQPLFDDRTTGFLVFDRSRPQLTVRFSDGTRSTVSTDPLTWVEAACRAAGRNLSADEWAVVRPQVGWRSTCDRNETAE